MRFLSSAFAFAFALVLLAGDVRSEDPFASAASLTAGRAVKRSSKDGTLTADDRARIRTMGLSSADAAVVVLRKIPKTDVAKQLARLRTLARSVDGFAPSGACDGITSEGEGRGLCTGSVDGPLGRVSARMPVAARLDRKSVV